MFFVLPARESLQICFRVRIGRRYKNSVLAGEEDPSMGLLSLNPVFAGIDVPLNYYVRLTPFKTSFIISTVCSFQISLTRALLCYAYASKTLS